jgi:hypothetical protein
MKKRNYFAAIVKWKCKFVPAKERKKSKNIHIQHLGETVFICFNCCLIAAQGGRSTNSETNTKCDTLLQT